MGQLFEKEEFNRQIKYLDDDGEEQYYFANDGDIENLLDPLDGWRLPTKEEWTEILGINNGQKRSGSTVNGVNNVHWAGIYLTGASFLGRNKPFGLLLFPDGEIVTGKTLNGYERFYSYDPELGDFDYTTDLTLSELNVYLEQGCVFLPETDCYDAAIEEWSTDTSSGYYWSSSADSDNDDIAYFAAWDHVSACVSNGPKINYMCVRLVKPVE